VASQRKGRDAFFVFKVNNIQDNLLSIRLVPHKTEAQQAQVITFRLPENLALSAILYSPSRSNDYL